MYKRQIIIRTDTAIERKNAMDEPFFARFSCPAPRFCPTKVVTDKEML